MSWDEAKRGAPQISGMRRGLHYEKLVLSDGAVHGPAELAQALAAGFQPHYVLIRVRVGAGAAAGAGVAWRADGVPPTATDGMPCEAPNEEDFNGDPASLQFIQLTADTVTVHLHYFY